jgi:hypothetical protein
MYLGGHLSHPRTLRRDDRIAFRPAACASPIKTSLTRPRVSVGTKVIVLPMTDRRADLGSTIR